ncbi:MAG: two-component regulator propeller domain-containing protein, partial [Cryomorphaceae bacterium]
MIKQSIFLFLLMLFGSHGVAQKSAYIGYGLEDGLPQSQVRAISRDSFGYLWIGTMAGLSRFDGSEFKNFSTEDGLNDNQINCFYQGSELYVGTTGALCFIKGQEISSIPFPEVLRTARIIDFAESNDGTLYMATAGSGVITWDGATFASITADDGLPDEYVRSLAFDKAGQLWIGTRSGIAMLKSPQDSISAPDSVFAKLSVSQIRMASNQQMVITTFGNGIFFVDGNSVQNITTDDGLKTDFIRCFEEISAGQYWFASKVGLAKFEDGKIDIYDESKGLSYANIKSLGQDREGNLWIGTDGQGLLRSAGEAFQIYSAQSGLKSDLVMSISDGGDGSLLLGTYDAGISVLKNDTAIDYLFNDLLPSYTVWCMSTSPKGLLVGTSLGLFIENKGETQVLDKQSGLPGDRITS